MKQLLVCWQLEAMYRGREVGIGRDAMQSEGGRRLALDDESRLDLNPGLSGLGGKRLWQSNGKSASLIRRAHYCNAAAVSPGDCPGQAKT
jgi:hypothetical protein